MDDINIILSLLKVKAFFVLLKEKLSLLIFAPQIPFLYASGNGKLFWTNSNVDLGTPISLFSGIKL